MEPEKLFLEISEKRKVCLCCKGAADLRNPSLCSDCYNSLGIVARGEFLAEEVTDRIYNEYPVLREILKNLLQEFSLNEICRELEGITGDFITLDEYIQDDHLGYF